MPCAPSANNAQVGQDQEADSAVERQLAIANLNDQLKFKILLLGTGESGKSTVLKQLKLIHKITLTDEERVEYEKSLKRNAAECMQVLIERARAFQYPIENEDKARADIVAGYDLDSNTFTCDIADNIRALWRNDSIQKAYARRKEFWILDSADYYFDNVDRFVQDDFVPTEEDCVMARVMTTGIINTEIPAPPITFNVVDVGGQRNERRKWIHCFDDVCGIVFVVNLAGYNSVLFEDPTMNRMEESLILFKQTVNNPAFAETPIFLVFNKKDLFEKLVRDDKINNCKIFSDYRGTEDLREILTYIANKFREQISSGASERLQVFHIAARFKRDVKTTWDDLAAYIKTKHKKNIENAVKQLEKFGQPAGGTSV